MIKLDSVSDRNKFTILWKNKDNKLIAYRYTSIVFGFVSSPFILQNVIQFHLKKFSEDECFKVLKQGMYVDNLFYTGNDSSEILTLYGEASSRMPSGGFDLRSWSSNNIELTSVFAADDTASPSSGDEKLLGYKYLPETDKMANNEFDTAQEHNTKRSILAYVSRIFDPLGLVLPLTVKAKLLIRELWQQKLEWDEKLPEDLSKTWSKIKKDLDKIPNFAFDRSCYEQGVSLIIFCDSSKHA